MKIKIGSTDYDLTLIKDLNNNTEDITEELKNGLTIYGETHPIKAYIKIEKDMPEQARRQVFFHEITHAMLAEIGAGELIYDEDFVDALSKQIYGFIKLNNVEKIYEFMKVK